MTSAVVSRQAGERRWVTTSEDLLAAVADAAATVEEPVIVSVEADAGTLTLVGGDPTGSSLVYFSAGYERTGTGSLHGVADRARRDADAWEPPQTAYLLGHHSEIPRWSVLPTDEARRALLEFFMAGGRLPSNIEWEPD